MIEDEKLKLKFAEDKREALANKTVESLKEANTQNAFQIELNNVILKHLEKEDKKNGK